MWDLDFQIKYQELLEEYPQSSNFYYGRIKEGKYEGDFLRIAQIYLNLDMEIWITEKIFPRIYFRKESKLEYSFAPYEFSDQKLKDFRLRVKDMLGHIGLEKLFVPPPESCMSADLKLYNDSGVVRKDWEKPEYSTTCGFLLQVFNPRPLGTREVWLPDYSTKVNNSFWMTIGRQFLLNSHWFPSDDAKETYERIAPRLTEGFFGYFDISAFGLQYPRELLEIIAEEISHYYPNPDLLDQLRLFKKLVCRDFPLQISKDKFVYPKRGIGLGYYEDLKTLGIMAILMPWHQSVISLYGDQGLISLHRKNFKYMKELMQELRSFNFIIKENKVDTKLGVVKWSGWTMGTTKVPGGKLRKRCQMTSSFCAIFDGEYHWERKNRVNSFYEEYPEYKKRFKRFAFDYESTYGWEFHPGDSFNSYKQCGVSPHMYMQVGATKFYRVQRLKTPKDQIIDNLVYSTPLFMDWKRTESRRFNNYRHSVYHSTRGLSEVFEYMNPVFELNKTIKFKPTSLQRAVSDRMEMRMIALKGLSVGKFTYGIPQVSWGAALRKYSLAPNPFEALATGGYTVFTKWHHPRRVSAEWYVVCNTLLNNVDYLEGNHVSYYSDFAREVDELPPQKKRKFDIVPYPNWGSQLHNPNLKRAKKEIPEVFRISLENFNVGAEGTSSRQLEKISADTILKDLASIARQSYVPDEEPSEDEILVDLEGEYEYDEDY
jgi:hypothetical protein